MSDPFRHMAEAWGLQGNPFPAEAIASSDQEPYSNDVFPDETQLFYQRLIRGAIQGRRSIGFLWSQGRGGDTGYGKTRMMYAAAREINTDLGSAVLSASGTPQDRIVPIAAAYANLNNTDSSGLYPVLFGAVAYAATPARGGTSLLDSVRRRIEDSIGSSEAALIRNHILSSWLRVAPGAPPLRMEIVDAFANDGANGVLIALSQVSTAARLRNGLQYLDLLLAILCAAGIGHLFVFVDQLEDLATNKSITAAKRSREIGRIRDLIEAEPYARRLHLIFTFHNTAGRLLDHYWQINRLPPYEIGSENEASMVVLKGLATDSQVAELLRVYLADERSGHADDDMLPFSSESLTILREKSQGRVGILLRMAHQLVVRAASDEIPAISGSYAERFLSGQHPMDEPHEAAPEANGPADIDDLLLR